MNANSDDDREALVAQEQEDRNQTSAKSSNVVWQDNPVKREDRERRRGHRGVLLWFTGLSGAGKTTLAMRLEKRLHREDCFTYVLDGDNVRHGLSGDLGFTAEDRNENIRRVGEVAKLFVNAGAMVATSFISPYRADRDRVREAMDREDDFIEVHVACPVEVCEERDPKGLYARARAGEIENFTGISAPYEAPESPELVVRTDLHDPETCVDLIMEYLRERGYLARLDEKTDGAGAPTRKRMDGAGGDEPPQVDAEVEATVEELKTSEKSEKGESKEEATMKEEARRS